MGIIVNQQRDIKGVGEKVGTGCDIAEFSGKASERSRKDKSVVAKMAAMKMAMKNFATCRVDRLLSVNE